MYKKQFFQHQRLKNFKLEFLIILFLFIFCRHDKTSEVQPFHPTPYQIKIPLFFPTKLNIPDDNPMTVEGIELGRYLFYDGRFSGRTDPDSLMSCSTCHLQANSFKCGINNPKFINGRPFGLSGKVTPHNMMPLINLVFNNEGYLWNGMISNNNTSLGLPAYGVPPKPEYNLKNIESIVWMAIVAPHEVNGSIERTVKTIQNIPMYPPMFFKAFGSDTVTIDRISKAIAQFVRTLISCDSKFDKYLNGEVDLADAERRGFELFTTNNGADCFHCHGTDAQPLFTTNLFYNNGKDTVFTDKSDRYSVTGNLKDIGAYRAPTLRNILYTAPYMHDGRFKTLDEVLNFYNQNVVWSPSISPMMQRVKDGGVHLTPSQISDLKAFLSTLSDEKFITNPSFSNPRPSDPYFSHN